MYVCTCTVGQNVPEGLPVAGTFLVESQHPLLQDDHSYSSVDDTQHKMFV